MRDEVSGHQMPVANHLGQNAGHVDDVLQQHGVGHQVEILDTLFLFHGIGDTDDAVPAKAEPIEKVIVPLHNGRRGHNLLAQLNIRQVFEQKDRADGPAQFGKCPMQLMASVVGSQFL